MSRQYCIVLGDVVESRSIDDRATFQENLQSTLASINEEFTDDMQAPFTVLKGVDEIGGVLKTVSPIADIQRRIARTAHPEQIRLAAVVGEVDVNPAAEEISAMDGEAFANADAVLAQLESDGLTFALHGDNPVLDNLISDEINLLDLIRADWTPRRVEILTKYENLGTQQAVADSLDISPQAVSNALTATNGKQILRIERRLSDAVQLYPSLQTDKETR